MLDICYSLDISVFSRYVIAGSDNVAVECAANLHAITLNHCIGSDLYLSISQNLAFAYFYPFC